MHGDGSGGGFADSIVNSALRFRAQAPIVDQLLREIGLDAGDINRLAGGAAGAAGRAAGIGVGIGQRQEGMSAMVRVYVSSVIDASADSGVGARARLQRACRSGTRASPTAASRTTSRATVSAASATSTRATAA